jgi:hypothetical protein
MKKLKLLQLVIEMKTTSSQDNKGSIGRTLGSIGWRTGLIVAGIALNGLALLFTSILSMFLAIPYSPAVLHFQSHPGYLVNWVYGVLLANAIFLFPTGAVGIILATKLSHHQPRAAKVLATVSAVMWTGLAVYFTVQCVPYHPVSQFELLASWSITVCLTLHALGQIYSARMIAKTAVA